MKLFLLTALAPILWGSTYMITALFLPADQPLWVATLRALPVGLVMVLMAPRRLPKGWPMKIWLLGAVNIAAFFALLFIATYRLPGGIAATLQATLPLMALAAQWKIAGRRPVSLQWIAGFAGVIGVSLLVLTPDAALDTVGLLAAFGACVALLSGMLLVQRWGMPMGLFSFTGWQLLTGGLCLLPMAFFIEGMPPVMTETNLYGMLWLGLVNTGLAYLVWLNGVPKLQTSQLAFLGLLSPVTAVVLGVSLVGETLSQLQWIAILVILISIPVVQFSRSSRQLEAS